MRGTPCPNGCQVLLTRFIPSYAGNAANTRPTVSPTPVHPRMRGERTVAVMIRSAPYGSSPHARGTLLYLGNSLAEYRFIPAYAGNAMKAPRCAALLWRSRQRGFGVHRAGSMPPG